MGTLIIVVVGSTLLFRVMVSHRVDMPAMLGARSAGVLIEPPRPIGDLPLRDRSGGRFDFAAQPRHWRILIPVSAHCDAQCRQTLRLTRQINTALGKDAGRVRRYLIAPDYPLDAAFEHLLKQQYPHVQVLRTDPDAFRQYFARSALHPLQNHQYLIVDPQGWLMMYYGPQHDGKGVLKDLKRLLAHSHENEGS